MPTAQLKALARQHGVSLATAERYWAECKESAGDDYARVVGCVKARMQNHAKGRASPKNRR